MQKNKKHTTWRNGETLENSGTGSGETLGNHTGGLPRRVTQDQLTKTSGSTQSIYTVLTVKQDTGEHRKRVGNSHKGRN